jgi:perosamine synthetase
MESKWAKTSEDSGPSNEIFMAGPDVGSAELSYVIDAVSNGWYGKEAYAYVERFEREFATYHDRAFGLMTPNCTSALHLILEGLGIGPGDEVIVPESTWIGSSAGIHHAGAQTVFADIDPHTWCVSDETLRESVTNRTAAVIAVDLYGNMPEWGSIIEFCDERGLPVIEDAAEALGSAYRGVRAGKYGVASVFSFHRTKTITTGEGGMLLTDDETLFERCRLLRDHGRQPGSYFNDELAFKYMPFNVQAALGYGQFTRIEELVAKKRHMFHLYRDLLPSDGSLQINLEDRDRINGAWATTVIFDRDTALTTSMAITGLAAQGIPARPFFHPLSSLPAYSGNETGGMEAHPVAFDFAGRGIHLPCALNLTDQQIAQVSDAIIRLLSGDHRACE